ncbi:MAG: hypothetical protein P4L33_08230 [Capsulimonadaceae bacterium]|nr:hypothetical protein [Capsulimonadaceae bacterium]
MDHLPRLVDCTLREGQQAAGVYFNSEQRRLLLRLLGSVGVDEIEIGYSARDAEIAGQIAEARDLAPSARIAVWCRALAGDIEIALAGRPDVVSVSAPVSDLHIEHRLRKSRSWVLERVGQLGRILSTRNVYASLGLEDATRAQPEFVVEVAQAAEAAGFARVRIADTVGIGTPASIALLVEMLKARVSVDIGIHAHNDFGMGAANALTALHAGAKWADVSVLGVGERAGIASLEEVVGFMNLRLHRREYDLRPLATLAALMADVTGDPLSKRRPIVGKAIFECESGLHQDGIAKLSETYEPYAPEKIGAAWTLSLGMKAGGAAVRSALARCGIEADPMSISEITARLRAASREAGRALTQAEFVELAHQVVWKVNGLQPGSA